MPGEYNLHAEAADIEDFYSDLQAVLMRHRKKMYS
jgi:hypothetical protein